jgi:hypothetical protein
MIFRLSQALAQKIKVAPKVCLPLDGNPFADWSAHVFTAGRTQYMIVTNTPSLYTLLMFGRGIADDRQFLDATLGQLRERLPADGHKVVFKKFVAPANGEIWFSKALNRGVTGSMNDMISCAKFHLVQREMSPAETAASLNDMPMSYLDHKIPREAFKGLAMNVEDNKGFGND